MAMNETQASAFGIYLLHSDPCRIRSFSDNCATQDANQQLKEKPVNRRMRGIIMLKPIAPFRPRPFAWCKTRGPNALIRG